MSAKTLDIQSDLTGKIQLTEHCLEDAQRRLKELRNNGRLSPQDCNLEGYRNQALHHEFESSNGIYGEESSQWQSQTSFKNLHLHLRILSAGSAARRIADAYLLLSYHSSGVSWSPEYDIKLEEDSVAVYAFGSVMQRTGL